MFSSRSGWINLIGLFIVIVTAALVVADRFALLPWLHPMVNAFYLWVLLLAAFALLLGVANVIGVHVVRVVHGAPEWPLSVLLIAAILLVVIAGLISPEGTRSPLLEWTFDAVIAPGQASLFALTGFFVLAAAYRYLRLDRPDALWILAGALVALLVQTPVVNAFLPSLLITFADWLLVWPVMAALRGALLGGALMVVLVAVRLIARTLRSGG